MQIWDQFLSHLEIELGKDTVERWVRPLKLVRFDAANIYLETEDSFQISWFEEHVRPHCKNLINNNGRSIQIILSRGNGKTLAPRKIDDFEACFGGSANRSSSADGGLPRRAGEEVLAQDASKGRFSCGGEFSNCLSSQTAKHSRAGKEAELDSFSIASDSLDPEMTIENFLVRNPANEIALKLVSEIENCNFNPLLLYGPQGSGKTHLLMAAAALLKQKRRNVFYVQASTFTEHVVQAIRRGAMQAVREAYRSADALLVDDIQIFSRKAATQEEFFHTFNELHTRGCPILLSSSTPPAKLTEIEPRLVSRFEWGISVGIEKEDWMSILEKKAKLWRLAVDSALLSFLVEKFPTSPLLALQALAIRTKDVSQIGPHLASLLLKDLLEKEAQRAWTPEKIVKAVAAHYGIRSTDILGKSQTREAALPRQIAMYMCREKLKLPFQKIGEIFNRDHSTVMASVRQIQEGIEKRKPEIAEAITAIAQTT